MNPLPLVARGPEDGAPVLFLHGFMGAAANWDEIAARLSDRFRCLAADLPGHGAATGLPERAYTMAGCSEALRVTLDAAGVPACAVVGYSMGGRLALYFALEHPARCRRLVLESASPGLETEAERAARRRTDRARARRLTADFRAFLDGWYRMPLFASLHRHEGLVEATVRRRLRNDPQELARSLAGMGTGRQPSLWPRLAEISSPSVVLAGALDEKYRALTEAMAARSAGRLKRAVVKRAGHNIHAERPARYVRFLKEFLT